MHSLRSAAVQYTNYGTGGAFELPTQSGTFTVTTQSMELLHIWLSPGITSCVMQCCIHHFTNVAKPTVSLEPGVFVINFQICQMCKGS